MRFLSRKRSRWCQFSIRSLLCAVLVLSLFLSWARVQVVKYRRQEEARQRINDLGGGVVDEPLPPNSLCTIIVKRFVTPTPTDIRGVCVTPRPSLPATRTDLDEILSRLKYLPRLNAVYFNYSTVANDQLALLRNLQCLEIVELSDTRITDRGLDNLAALENLKYLNVANTEISGKALAQFPRLPQLEGLILDGTQMEDGGTALLSRLTSLRILALDRDNVTDKHLAHLSQLPNLTCLIIPWRQVSDPAIKQLYAEAPPLVVVEFQSLVDVHKWHSLPYDLEVCCNRRRIFDPRRDNNAPAAPRSTNVSEHVLKP